MTWRVLLIGEHDKGLGEPFHGTTLSGRRLRTLLARLPGIQWDLCNMMAHTSQKPTSEDLARLEQRMVGCEYVVMLGRKVLQHLHYYLHTKHPHVVYLPHPGARTPRALADLELGLGLIWFARPNEEVASS